MSLTSAAESLSLGSNPKVPDMSPTKSPKTLLTESNPEGPEPTLSNATETAPFISEPRWWRLAEKLKLSSDERYLRYLDRCKEKYETYGSFSKTEQLKRPKAGRMHSKAASAAGVMGQRDEDLGREFFEEIEEFEADKNVKEYVEYEERMYVPLVSVRTTKRSRKIEKGKIEKGKVEKSKVEGNVIGLDKSLSSHSDPWWLKEDLTKPGPKDPKASPETLPIEYDPWWSEEHSADSGPTAPGMSLTKSPENLLIESDPWWSKEYLTESDPQGAKPTLTKEEETLPWWSFLNDEPWWSEKFLTDFVESSPSGVDPGRRVRRKRRNGWERKWERTHFKAAVASGVMGEKDEDLGREFFEEIEEIEVPEDLKQYVGDEEHVRVSIMSFRRTRRSLNIDDEEEDIENGKAEKGEIKKAEAEKAKIQEDEIEKGAIEKVEIDKSEVEQNVAEVDEIEDNFEDDFEEYDIEEDGFEGNFEPYGIEDEFEEDVFEDDFDKYDYEDEKLEEFEEDDEYDEYECYVMSKSIRGGR
ncbi:hypothetical protein V490_04591 [Pseudogymnoascus sp. VKM F-3557]|nr:hypothetical protein V490_04591 [Pseudogymnoascus sp. VKM F-3557]